MISEGRPNQPICVLHIPAGIIHHAETAAKALESFNGGRLNPITRRPQKKLGTVYVELSGTGSLGGKYEQLNKWTPMMPLAAQYEGLRKLSRKNLRSNERGIIQLIKAAASMMWSQVIRVAELLTVTPRGDDDQKHEEFGRFPCTMPDVGDSGPGSVPKKRGRRRTFFRPIGPAGL